MHNLVTLLKQYCAASGQQVNLQKSSVFFGSNVLTGLSAEHVGILCMPQVTNLERISVCQLCGVDPNQRGWPM